MAAKKQQSAAAEVPATVAPAQGAPATEAASTVPATAVPAQEGNTSGAAAEVPATLEPTIDPDGPGFDGPGEITDRAGYEAALASGAITELGTEDDDRIEETLKRFMNGLFQLRAESGARAALEFAESVLGPHLGDEGRARLRAKRDELLARPTLAELEQAKFIEVVTLDPKSDVILVGGHVCSPTPRTYEVAAIKEHGPGYLRAFAENTLIDLRIVE
jgi:hypothetical protein